MKQRALITGASRGIGAAIAEALARAGHPVIVNYKSNQAAAQALQEKIAAAGGEAELLRFDVADAAEAAAATERLVAEDEARPIGIIVNNAGVTADNSFPLMERADWERVTRTSLDGFYNVTRPLLMCLVRRRWGRIISSTGAPLIMSVSMRPGATQLTVTLRRATSAASERVAPMRPALAAE